VCVYICLRASISHARDGEIIRKWVYALLIYGITSLILSILVNEEVLYVPIDAMVSFWSYVFLVFNPVPMLYRSVLIGMHGPSVWIDSGTMVILRFVYPIIMIIVGLILLFYGSRIFVRKKK
jgi:hypothetical protein